MNKFNVKIVSALVNDIDDIQIEFENDERV